MDWTKATKEQLWAIVTHDKDCPTDLMCGVVGEMINRQMLGKMIHYILKLTYKNPNFVIKHILQMEYKEIINIAYAEIYRIVKWFKPGFTSFKTYLVGSLRIVLIRMFRDAKMDKRAANIETDSIDMPEEKLREKLEATIFRSGENVEKTVVNKIMLEDALNALNEREKRAVTLVNVGYSGYDVGRMLGLKYARSGHKVLKQAYKKMRVVLQG